jgi:acetyl-CoA acetyltransferase
VAHSLAAHDGARHFNAAFLAQNAAETRTFVFAAVTFEVALWEGTRSPLMVNASGGLKGCGHPVAATGVKQLLDTGKQLRANKERFGIAHNFGGVGASAGIHILENIRA